MFKNLAIKWKLASLVLIMLFAMGVIGLTGFSGTRQIANAMHEIGEVRLPSIQGLLTLSEAQTAIKAANLSAAIYENSYNAQNQFAEVLSLRKKAWSNANSGWKQYEPLPQTAEEAVLWKQFEAEWEAWKRADSALNETITALSKNTSEQVQKDLFTQFYKQYEAFAPLFISAENTLNKIVALNESVAKKEITAGNEASAQASQAIIVAGFLAVVVCLACAAFIAASITKPIAQAVVIAEAVAEGDLTKQIEVTSKDETGQLKIGRAHV